MMNVEWSLIAFAVVALLIVLFMLIVPPFLGGKSHGREKHQPFESGIVGAGKAHIRLSAKFYLVAIFFVIFDIEALFLFAWATSVVEVGWMGYVEVFVFVSVLLVGLIYVIRVGALNWSPADRGVTTKSFAKNGLVKDAIDLSKVTDFVPFEELAKDRLGKIPAQLNGELSAPNPTNVTQ